MGVYLTMQPTLTALELKIFQKESKNIVANIYRIQAYDLIMCGYFCIGLIDFIYVKR